MSVKENETTVMMVSGPILTHTDVENGPSSHFPSVAISGLWCSCLAGRREEHHFRRPVSIFCYYYFVISLKTKTIKNKSRPKDLLSSDQGKSEDHREEEHQEVNQWLYN